MNDKQLAQRSDGTERTDDETTPNDEECRTMPDDEAVLTYEVTGDERVSEGVVAALGAVSNADPAELNPLAEAIDPDALDSLFADRHDGTPRSSGHAQFEFCGHDVVVNGAGHVSVFDSTE